MGRLSLLSVFSLLSCASSLCRVELKLSRAAGPQEQSVVNSGDGLCLLLSLLPITGLGHPSTKTMEGALRQTQIPLLEPASQRAQGESDSDNFLYKESGTDSTTVWRDLKDAAQ